MISKCVIIQIEMIKKHLIIDLGGKNFLQNKKFFVLDYVNIQNINL